MTKIAVEESDVEELTKRLDALWNDADTLIDKLVDLKTEIGEISSDLLSIVRGGEYVD